MPSNSIPIFLTTSIFQLKTSTGNRSNRRGQAHTLSFAKPKPESSFAPMSLKEVLTSPKLTGLSNTTLPMIQMITSTELEELVEDKKVVDVHSSSF